MRSGTCTMDASISSPAITTPIYHFKILVPAAAAGRIIGKGGSTIAQLQKDAGARVKMSKASEFYPGTTERVCLISGPIEGILKINDFFMENFSSTSIKILVPNSTAGMIIGKGGSYIKQIKEDSGAYVQISQKCTDLSLPERCVTIVGDLDNIRKACSMILSKIVEDVGSSYRDIRTSTTTSLTNNSTTLNNQLTLSSPLSSFNNNSSSPLLLTNTTTPPIISLATTAASNLNSSPSLINSTSSSSHPLSPTRNNNDNNNNNISPPIATTFGSGAATSSPTSSPAVCADMNSAQIIESIKLVLRVSGYGEDAVSEITSAMSTLANYGVLGVGLGLL